MIDRVTVAEQGKTPEFPFASDMTGRITVLPTEGRKVPLHPFLHRGDRMNDPEGNTWTVLTAHVHQGEKDDGRAYLWYGYEVVNGARLLR
jgi:hypothetical protein